MGDDKPHIGNLGMNPPRHNGHRVLICRRKSKKRRIVQPLPHQMSDASMSDEDDFSCTKEE